jgi:hypothetical protein
LRAFDAARPKSTGMCGGIETRSELGQPPWMTSIISSPNAVTGAKESN